MSRTMPRMTSAKTSTEDAVKVHRFSALMVLMGIFILAVLAAQPAKAFYAFPQCDDSKVEERIFKDFRWADKHTWQRGLEIMSLSRVHEHRTDQHDGSIVSRRYCMAHAHLSDGKRRTLYFMITDRGGFAGISWKVTHCIVGLDTWKNHDGYCRAIR